MNDICKIENDTIRSVIVYSIFFCTGFFYKEISKLKLTAISVVAFMTCYALYALGVYGCDMQINKFPPNAMFLIYGIGFICFLGRCFSSIKIKENAILNYYNVHGYTIYLYQNIGFLIASCTFGIAYSYVSSPLYKLIIFVLTLFSLLIFHAFLAGCIDNITKKLL